MLIKRKKIADVQIWEPISGLLLGHYYSSIQHCSITCLRTIQALKKPYHHFLPQNLHESDGDSVSLFGQQPYFAEHGDAEENLEENTEHMSWLSGKNEHLQSPITIFKTPVNIFRDISYHESVLFTWKGATINKSTLFQFLTPWAAFSSWSSFRRWTYILSCSTIFASSLHGRKRRG